MRAGTLARMITPTPKLLLTTVEAAERLGVHAAIVRRLIATGALPSVACPGSASSKPQRRIRTSDLDAYVAGLSG